MQRVLTAAVLLAILLATIKAPPFAFSAVALLFIAVATWESYRIIELDGGRPLKGLGLVAVLAITWSFLGFRPHFGPEVPIVWLGILATTVSMWRRPDPRQMLRAAGSTLFPVVIVGLGLGFLVGLRSMPGHDGEDLLMLLFSCVILADTAAFYVGTVFGKRPLAPLISPNKSLEGGLAGMIASIGAALIAHVWFYQRLPLGHAVALGALLGLASILGDLAESMIKRSAGVKDSSHLLPGHGGVLDRADSLLFAAPVLYFYYQWFLRGAS